MSKVICLGKEFNSEEERRKYFRNELRAKLPELKKIEGFPIGEDEDIINLSDPPYYTACPNPWLNEFIAEWEKEKESIPGRQKEFHVDEPYASDVSEGKNNPIYNAHGYHTKVPHPAIMRYILHYTQPGDIVLDGFAGTGMTGVAAIMCGNPDMSVKLKIENDFAKIGLQKPTWGKRPSIISDLSPEATFISYVYNTSFDFEKTVKSIEDILSEANNKFGWLYETEDEKSKKGRVNYIIWSDVYTCPQCSAEIVYWDEGIDKELGKVKDIITCKSCNTQSTKDSLDRAFVTKYDKLLKSTVQVAKCIPVLMSYSRDKKRHEKKPDSFDKSLLDKIDQVEIISKVPVVRMPEGDEARRNDRIGITHVHQFWTYRNLILLSYLWEKGEKIPVLRWAISGILQRANKQHQIAVSRVGGPKANDGGKTAGHRRGTLYVPSIQVEFSVFELLEERLKIVYKAIREIKDRGIVSTVSATNLPLADNSIDYIFIDPPFGANIMYSELNFLWESWLNVKTNNLKEAIQNRTQGKSLLEYQRLMECCFSEFYRVLKPNKWITVEFSNTSASVWNSIQVALQRSGFIVSNVSSLDKMQETHSARTSPTAVKQDLVISCYKPSIEFDSILKSKTTDVSVWEFILEHFNHLPTHVKRENSTAVIIERSPKILYDRLITFYLMRGLPVPIDAKDFQEGLKQRFVERDGMYFIAEQAAEYDEKKAKAPKFVQLSLIVTNESDAIEWLKDRLRKQAQKYQDIMPDFRIATQSLRKGDTLPELQDILNENFIQESDGRWRTPDPNEAKDREALRTKVLLKEFNGYVTAISQPRAKKLKEVRVEALRAGFKNCWEQKDFKTIVTLGDMIPQNILLEDEQLLMYYDIAKDRV